MSGRSFPPSHEFSTFVDLIRWRATRQPEQLVYTFLADGEKESASLSFGALDSRARAIAAVLQDQQLPPNTRVLLLYPPGLDFLAAFFGCLYADTVAVPAVPPHSNRSLPKLSAIINDSRPQLILTSAAMRPRLDRWLNLIAPDQVQVLTTDNVADGVASEWQRPAIKSNGLAFLQYTSGSTAAPKGVMVTYRNLLHNEKLIQAAFKQTESSIVVGWLPPYHDMGLIGMLLQPLFSGGRCVFMPPMVFLQNPRLWLQCISRYRATTSGGPNFAYELCLEKITAEEKSGLDLSTWEIAFNGSEVVRVETMERFARAFKSCGFNERAFHPCYGLAEATLLVSGSRGSQTSEGGYAGCGKFLDDTMVVVVDPQSGKPCAPGEVGELWVSGPGVAAGYWNRPEETAETFGATLPDESPDPFLRTGDLGFVKGQDVFITGRLKDLIIIRGRNYYPHDIELTVEKCHPALQVNSGAAFAVVIDGEERLVVVQELDRKTDPAGVALAVQRAIAEEHELYLHEIVFVRAGTIPKTTSGKIQRHLCRQRYLANELKVIARDAAAGPRSFGYIADLSREILANTPATLRQSLVEEYLQDLLAQLSRVLASRPQKDEPVIAYLLDSLNTAEFKQRVEDALDVHLSFSGLLGGNSIAVVARNVLQQLDGESTTRFVTGVETGPQPLSYGQKALWFLYKLAPESGAYNLAAAARLCGLLDARRLRAAFEQLVERHPSLRTAIVVQDGAPLGLIGEPDEISLTSVDAEDWAVEQLHEELAREARRPFDLERDSLLRVTLFRRAREEHVILLVLHHIVADFRSLEVLFDELSRLYRGSDLERPRARYENFVDWQKSIVESAEGERHWQFWSNHLQGQLPELELPVSGTRPSSQTYTGANVSLQLPPLLMDQVKALAQAQGCTPYMVLLAAFYLLLNRYSGQDDIVVGSPVNGRSEAEFLNLIGYFVNQLPLRCDISGNPTFVEFLGRVRGLVLDAFEHQDYPFALLVERLQPARNASRAPLFQTMFVLQQASRPETKALSAFALGQDGGRLRLENLEVESLSLDQGTAQFELTLMLAETDHGLGATLQYNSTLFNAAWAAKMLEHYANLLASIVTTPEKTIASLAMLSESEEKQLLVEWNATSRDYPRSLLLHERFEAQAELSPDSVALIWNQESLTYRELNARANQLAHYLKSLGVGPETNVAVFVGRSPKMLIALLAVLKAGGAYVALDRSYPAERISFMLQDARARLLLTEEALRERVSQQQTRTVWLDHERQSIAQCSEANPERSAAPENLAYVIYTSGSTGQPKGVALEHRNAVNLLEWAGEFFDGELEGVLASTSICFDLSIFELFAPLSCGGTVILAENALELPHLPAKEKVTLINTVPSAMSELVNSGRLPASVRTVNLAGEPLNRSLVESIYERSSAQRVFNLYGPSEGTTYSTGALITKDNSSSPSIGRPIANTEVYILDREVRTVPIGTAGELYLGGAGLARGYLNRPELTAQQFIPNPFSKAAGAVLYRTGDRVRYLKDGQIEFLGRVDQQIKLRGFRVELGEIQAVLQQHEAVKEVVITAATNNARDRHLVAYVVFHPERQVTVAELKRVAKEKLPDYMVPAAFVILSSLPLNENGKVDRRALPPPSWEMQGTTTAAPQTHLEEVLAGIWADILHVEEVGLDDNFFDAGGHSLLAARLIARVQSVFKVNVPLRKLFEAPTLRGIAEWIRESLESGFSTEVTTLKPASRKQPLPLSYAQQRLWFQQQLDTTLVSYNMPIAIRLTGNLDVEALEHSLTEIVTRHEVLRTNFVEVDGEPLQLIAEPEAVRLSLTDLSELPESERPAVIERSAIAAGRQRFDLSRDRLFCCELLRLGPVEHILLITLYHAVADEWSLQILLRELAARMKDQELPELTVQYADYAIWQRQHEANLLDEHLDYWKRELAIPYTPLELPTDRRRPPRPTFQGATVSRAIGEELLVHLKALARQQNATLFMVLLTAFKVLLSRYTNRSDIVVCTPVSTRAQRELENLIGCFINILPLRTEVFSSSTFAECLSRVREVALSSYMHQELPFDLLSRELNWSRNLAHNPLFQVMFAFQGLPLNIDLPELELEPLSFDYGVSKCDLTLVVEVKENGLVASLEYSTDLFAQDTAARMLDHYLNLLEASVVHPEQRIAVLPLLDQTECQRQNVEWNSTRAAYPSTCVHEQFERQAELTPEAVAVVCGDAEWSYQELNERSNQVARYLQRQGVGVESKVGLLLERAPWLLCGMLGVLKAGAAYVPLDVMSPALRLREQVADAGVAVVLSEQRWAEKLAGTRVLDVDGAEQESRAAVASGVMLDNLAYVIYTSGSTGKPKGVMVSHRALVNHSFAVAAAYRLSSEDRVLQFASPSFDVAAEEIFPSLLNGATVYISSPQGVLAPDELLRYVAEHRLSVLNLPASYWSELIDYSASLPLDLRLLVLGSEPVLTTQLIRWREVAGDRVVLLNAYGTTETTITSTIYEPPVNPETANAVSLSIGRPVANTEVYVLDEHLNAQPVGELYIGGDGLARGYLNDAALTAEKFVPNLYSQVSGARMYRSGDRGRYLAGGELEFLGRRDEQVKVRGYRIELREVELAIEQHVAVRRALACKQQLESGEQRLLAYFVRAEEAALSTGELRRFLTQRLPEYAIPSGLIEIETLPLTASGKVDRRALAARAVPVIEAAAEHVAPRTIVEELVTNIWTEVLDLQHAGVDDSFIELGGHSLLAARIVSRVRHAFGVELSLVALFTFPTIRGMAQTITRALRNEPAATFPIKSIDRTGPVPLSASQQRLWFLDQLQPGSSSYNISGALRLRGKLNIPALERSLNEIVRRHEALRTTFATVDGNPVQIVNAAHMLALPTVDLGGLSAAETAERVNQLLSDQAQAAFNLHEGPLIRLLLIREAEESHVVSLTMHHIISDAWSLANYTRELTTIYAAYNSGLESPLPELSIQYGDYSLWQEQHLRSESLSRQRAYWNDRLRGLAKLQLPTDHPRPQRPSSRGATQSFELNEELSTSLKDLSRREGVTLFMTLLAAFQTQLSRYSGQQDVAVGTDVANRELLETEPLIGFFINTLVLRTDLSGDPTFRQLLARVRRGTLDGLANQDVPFHDLVKAVQPERNLGLNPLFQVMFIMQNAPASIFSLPGLSVTPIKVDDESSAFDLSVSVEDERDRVGGTFRYSTDLFESKTITRMIEHFTNLLSDIARNPEARLSALEMLEEQTRVVKDKFEGLVAVRPKAISVTRNGLIKSGYLTPDATLPLVVQPALDDVDLVSWATQNRDFVEENLLKHGAILFRNFEVDSLEQFESFTKQTSDRLIAYGERSSPRTALTGHVYTSTDHPADQTILLHNEQSYTLEWPSKIWFYCQQPATRAGRTPIADSRKIAHRLVNVQEKFAQRGVMYVRNYSERFGLPWQEVFQTTSKERVEEYCRSVAIEVEWKVSGELRTRQVREALRAHPRTGEQVWFNHALFFHVSSLEESIRRSMTEGISEADLPYNTYYGDGSAIEPEVLEQIRAAYRLEMVSFDWQRGDILMVDNMLVAHGRESFTGERKIAVVMGDPITAALPEKSEIARI